VQGVGSGSAAADAQALAALRRQRCGCFIDSGSAAAAAQRPTFTSAVQGVGSGSTAASAVQGLRYAGIWQRQRRELAAAAQLGIAGRWQRQHSSAAAEQGVGSGSAAAGKKGRCGCGVHPSGRGLDQIFAELGVLGKIMIWFNDLRRRAE
jgi:hypothetical protein